MTRFVDVAALRRIVNRVGADQFLVGMTETMRQDFVRWEEFEKMARVANHSDIGVIELMPISDETRYSFKYVNGHPGNEKRGVSTVMAFGALADVDTGYPTLVSELTVTTAFRTAAATAIASQALARPDSKTLALIGCGAQSEFQALAFRNLLGIEEIRVFDIDPAAVAKFCGHMQQYPDLKIVVAESTASAVRGADIVTTCTADKRWATILTPDMIEPGMHINGLGGDCPGKTEIHADILKAAKIFVEFEPQTRIEGDIQQLAEDHPVHDLWRVVAGNAAGRDDAEQVTFFDSVGFALEDFSALRYVQHLALELNEGEEIGLIPDMDDPKDLFAQLNEDVSSGAKVQVA
ncbi:MAG: ornithine cyclodeaminase [Pseudomonadota bacterium]